MNKSERKLTLCEKNWGIPLLRNHLNVCVEILEINDIKNNKNCTYNCLKIVFRNLRFRYGKAIITQAFEKYVYNYVMERYNILHKC